MNQAQTRILDRIMGASGWQYVAHFADPNLLAGESIDLLVITPADDGKRRYARHQTSHQVTASAFVYEGTTVSANGTPLVFLSKDRSSGLVAGTLVFEGPTITALGLELEVFHFGFDDKAGIAPDDYTSRHFWQLAPATTYLFRLTSNKSDNAASAFVHLTEED